MAKQTSNQRHEVNRAEFKKWKAKVVVLERQMRRVLRLTHGHGTPETNARRRR